MSPTRRSWSLTRWASLGFTAIGVLFVASMLLLFLFDSLAVWAHAGSGYLTGTRWFYRSSEFGTLPMLYGTLVVAAIALLLAAPIGIGAAIFSSEFLPDRVRLFLKVTVELLAGVPSVVYGLLGVLVLRTYVYDALTTMGLDPISGDSLLTAGLLLAVMVLPTVMTFADDALRAVPLIQRQAARGLGLSRAHVILTVVLPQAKKGLIAAVLLALGRGLGETIAVFLVVGRQDNQWPGNLLSLSPLWHAGQTLTSKLGGAEVNIAYGDPLHWSAMVGLGLLLLLLVLLVTATGTRLAGSGARA